MSKIPHGFAGPCPKMPEAQRCYACTATTLNVAFVPLASGRRFLNLP